MNSKEFSRLRADSLSLEPLAGETMTAAPVTMAPAQFKANTRSKSDRREGADRRESLRFQNDRREKDRRPRKSWESGKNL